VTFPSLSEKFTDETSYPPRVFLEALLESGWTPGTVPQSVVFTYARFELYLATRPDLYTPNHMLGTGPGRFYLVNESDGRVGINCLGVGAPAAVAVHLPDLALRFGHRGPCLRPALSANLAFVGVYWRRSPPEEPCACRSVTSPPG